MKMKKALFFSVLATIALLFSSCAREPKEIKFLTSLEEALTISKHSGKPIMVDLYTDWCSWCKELDSKTYTDTQVIAFVNKNLVPLKINAEEETYLPKKFNVTGYPTILFIDGNEKEVDRLVGYYPAEDYLSALEELFIKNRAYGKVLEEYSKEYSYENAKTLIEKLQVRKDTEGILKITGDILSHSPADTYAKSMKFNILAASLNDDLEKYEKEFLELSEEIEKGIDTVYSDMQLDFYMISMIYQYSKKNYLKAREYLKKIDAENQPTAVYESIRMRIQLMDLKITMGLGELQKARALAEKIDERYLPVGFKKWLGQIKKASSLKNYVVFEDIISKFLTKIQDEMAQGIDITSEKYPGEIPDDPVSMTKLIYKCEMGPDGKMPSVLSVDSPAPEKYETKRIAFDLTQRNIVLEP